MAQHSEHDLVHLETRLRGLSDQLGTMGDSSDLKELFSLIDRPGWTTPAEYALVSGIVDAMQQHSSALTTLRQSLVNGSRLIGKQADDLIPQPLPPGPPEQ